MPGNDFSDAAVLHGKREVSIISVSGIFLFYIGKGRFLLDRKGFVVVAYGQQDKGVRRTPGPALFF